MVVDVLIDPVADVPNVFFDPVDGVLHAGAAIGPELSGDGVLGLDEPEDAAQQGDGYGDQWDEVGGVIDRHRSRLGGGDLRQGDRAGLLGL